VYFPSFADGIGISHCGIKLGNEHRPVVSVPIRVSDSRLIKQDVSATRQVSGLNGGAILAFGTACELGRYDPTAQPENSSKPPDEPGLGKFARSSIPVHKIGHPD
jgi:hypothetical protein